MSTILNTEGSVLEIPEIRDKENFRVAIVTANWNKNVNDRLLAGALEVFEKAGLRETHVEQYRVPGAVELVYAAARIMKSPKKYNAIIAIGTVIRGDTPHFDYVCSQAADGICRLNCEGDTPVIFGVLTVNNLQQALDRAGGSLGNKGAEAAVAAIEMGSFLRI
ncbi:MAG: 6,7-dimethyl-8-ribityllumazine synthase [Muribaculum sp.]|nr:6,7-dimethyl-8-ribityllumazine synthase [Muribaculum sp.]